jgi:hypothetical protein
VNVDVAAAPIVTTVGEFADADNAIIVFVAENEPLVILNMFEGALAVAVKLPPVATILPPPELLTVCTPVVELFVPVHSTNVITPVPVFVTALDPAKVPGASSALI